MIVWCWSAPSWRGCACCVRPWAPLAPTWPTWTLVWPIGCGTACEPTVSPFHPAAFQVRYCRLSSFPTGPTILRQVVQFPTECPVFQKVVLFFNRLCSFPTGLALFQQVVQFSNRSCNFATGWAVFQQVFQFSNRLSSFPTGCAVFHQVVQFTNRLSSFPTGCPVFQQVLQFCNRLGSFATDFQILQHRKHWIKSIWQAFFFTFYFLSSFQHSKPQDCYYRSSTIVSVPVHIINQREIIETVTCICIYKK
jgi:hypothetical protein